ncbi:DUF2442 domain-containing protein [candidate division KSB1 bacterium]|nr:DUF2442 domain-containing protein [candidate division KSB1 bacterium]
MKKVHHVKKIKFTTEKMFLHVDGKKYVFSLEKISKKLYDALEFEREKFEISPSGYGIHWPLLDEDLSIDGLIGVEHDISQPREKVMM